VLLAPRFQRERSCRQICCAGFRRWRSLAACTWRLGCSARTLLADSGRKASTENRLIGREWWWLAAAVGCGGVLGPLALFHGLRWSSGYTAGLLLNFEACLRFGWAHSLRRARWKARTPRIALVLVGAVAL